MSDLPSREEISEALTFAHITDSDGDHLSDIAQAYVEGRLVDREAINIEAAAAEYVFATDPVPPRTWDMLPFFEQQTKLAVARAIVDAALGEAP